MIRQVGVDDGAETCPQGGVVLALMTIPSQRVRKAVSAHSLELYILAQCQHACMCVCVGKHTVPTADTRSAHL